MNLFAWILTAEYLLGGTLRLSNHPRVVSKNTTIAPILYPLIPFREVRAHNLYVGAWMVLTGVLWGIPATRGWLGTLGLSLFWTGAGAWSQARAEMPFWLPIVNMGVSFGAWWVG